MSFTTKAFASFMQSGFKHITANVFSVSHARQFHAIVKPFPRPSTEPSAISQNPILISVVSPVSGITGLQRLLVPVSSLLNQVSGFKVKGRLKRRCKDCYFVVRQQRSYVICPTHPRHKQMSMKKREYKSWILTHATQSKVRPY